MKYLIAYNKRTGKAYAGRDFSGERPRNVYADEYIPPKLFCADMKITQVELQIRKLGIGYFMLKEIDIPVGVPDNE